MTRCYDCRAIIDRDSESPEIIFCPIHDPVRVEKLERVAEAAKARFKVWTRETYVDLEKALLEIWPEMEREL